MFEMKLHPDYFNLVRTGKKRTMVCTGARFGLNGALQFEPAVLVNSENEKMRIEILVHRIAYTAVGLLTTEDAVRDGFLSLNHLHAAMRKHYPTLDLDDVVTIYYFQRTDREEG